jgi:hypothetical protein
MSTPSADEGGVEELTQEIHEQQIVNKFDYLTTQSGPQRGAVVLRLLGFGVVTLVGIDPEEARVGDIAVEVAHSGLYTRVKVWLKVRDGARGWVSISEL